jgi:hypothetical protein
VTSINDTPITLFDEEQPTTPLPPPEPEPEPELEPVEEGEDGLSDVVRNAIVGALTALMLAEIERVTNRYAFAGDWRAWEDGMRNAIAAGHSSAAMVAVGERLFGRNLGQWIQSGGTQRPGAPGRPPGAPGGAPGAPSVPGAPGAPRPAPGAPGAAGAPGLGGLIDRLLPRADRERLQQAVQEQLGYLRRFVSEAANLSPKAIMARARMYAGAVRKLYYVLRWGAWIIPPHLLPGNQICMGNCRCSISIRDNGDGTGVLTRVMGGENHCTECPPLAGDHPVQRRTFWQTTSTP